jgi:hypothetical protein
VKNIVPTPEELRDCFKAKHKINLSLENGNEQEDSKVDFFSVLDEFVKECSRLNNWSASTKKKFTGVKNHLMAFNPKITFEFLSESGLNATSLICEMEKNLEIRPSTNNLVFSNGFCGGVSKRNIPKISVMKHLSPN